MSKPVPTSKRRFRFQFNLLAVLLLVSVVSVGAGVWINWVEPVRVQWAAVEPMLEQGAYVTTSPSDLPRWMKSVLPEGKTENIEALFFTETKSLKSDDLKCLARLPHLRQLCLEGCELDDAGVAWIADCPTIEELTIKDNDKVTDISARVLACYLFKTRT